MSDSRDRDSSGRRRRRRGNRKERDVKEPEPPVQPVKPIILAAKPPSLFATETAKVPGDETQVPSPKPFERKPMIMVKPRDESSTSAVPHSIPISVLTGEAAPNPVYHLQRHAPSLSPALDTSDQSRLSVAPDMSQSVKLVDEHFQWCELGSEMLLDNTDFLVVGVIGPQGVGKSSILSWLAGNSHTDCERNGSKKTVDYVFRPQTRDTRETCSHQTTGIDMFVTSERLLLLDTQPVLSLSVLDRCVKHEKKYSAEYSSVENYVEMQSLQIASFLLTVCNVVIVVQDWFVDSHFLRFINTAQMLKPPPPAASHDTPSGSEENSTDYNAHLVFVQNRTSGDSFTSDVYQQMKKVLHKHFEDSPLKYKEGINMSTNKLVYGATENIEEEGCNLFLVPQIDRSENKDFQQSKEMPRYKGHPSSDTILSSFRNQIMSMPRCLLTHTVLSEKNWFHYAARTWDAVRKSQMMSEYNRLLPSHAV